MNSCFALNTRATNTCTVYIQFLIQVWWGWVGMGEGSVHVNLKVDTFRRKHSTYHTTDYESSSKNNNSCTKLLDIISPQKPNNLKATNMHVWYNNRCLLSYKCHTSRTLSLYYMGLSNNTLWLIDNGKKIYLHVQY